MGCRASVVLEQPLDIVELDLRPHRIGETTAQLLENATGALDVDFARYLDRLIPVVGTTQRPAERISVRVGSLLGAAGLSAGARSERETLLLQGLRERLSTAAHGFDCPALGIDRTVGVAFAECSFGFAHGLAGAAKLVEIAALIALLARIEPAPLHLVEQLFHLIAQCLLVLTQFAHLVALVTLLAALAALPALILALLEGAIAQLLLVAQHFAEIIEHGHHVVVHVAVH